MAIKGGKYIYLLFAICMVSLTCAQTRYSTSKSYIIAKQEGSNNTGSDYASAYPDTSINTAYNYVPRNFMGNFGLPQPNYLLDYASSPLGFRLYALPFSNDLIAKQQVRYFKTEGPFASLTGITGSKQEQMFKMNYAQTFRKRLNIGLQFNRYGIAGFYRNQRSFVNNFYTSQNYTSANKRFGFYSYLLFNKIRYQESGGLKYDTLFNPLTTKELLDVKITNAKREIKELYGSFNPWIKLNKRSDSEAVASHYLDYKFNYTGNYYQYTDANSGTDLYYKNFYLDDTKTKDTTHLRQFVNSAAYTLKLNKAGLAASAGYVHEYNQLHQFADSVFSHQLIKATVRLNRFMKHKDSTALNRNRRLISNLSYDQIFSGPNTGDMKVEWQSEFITRLDEKGYATRKSSRIFLSVLSETRHPDYLYNTWYSNHFQWENKFKPQQLFQVKAGANHTPSGLSGSVLYQSYNNFLYFDSTALPKQATAAINNLAFNLNFEKVFFKHLGVRANVVYQTTNGSNYQRIAPSAESGALYYYGNLAKNNLQLMVGVQAEMYQSFKAYAYMPATNVFYLQNRSTVGDYPFVDIFLSGRIRPVQFFVKVTNVLQGFAGSNYYFVPGYIQPDRAFHFGLTWLFFD